MRYKYKKGDKVSYREMGSKYPSEVGQIASYDPTHPNPNKRLSFYSAYHLDQMRIKPDVEQTPIFCTQEQLMPLDKGIPLETGKHQYILPSDAVSIELATQLGDIICHPHFPIGHGVRTPDGKRGQVIGHESRLDIEGFICLVNLTPNEFIPTIVKYFENDLAHFCTKEYVCHI